MSGGWELLQRAGGVLLRTERLAVSRSWGANLLGRRPVAELSSWKNGPSSDLSRRQVECMGSIGFGRRRRVEVSFAGLCWWTGSNGLSDSLCKRSFLLGGADRLVSGVPDGSDLPSPSCECRDNVRS